MISLLVDEVEQTSSPSCWLRTKCQKNAEEREKKRKENDEQREPSSNSPKPTHGNRASFLSSANVIDLDSFPCTANFERAIFLVDAFWDTAVV